AIRYGKLLPEAMAFIESNKEALQQKSFNLFVVCFTLTFPDEESTRIVSGYLDPVRAYVEPAHEGLFAGVIDFSKLKWREQMLLRFLRVRRGDFRDWPAIEAWAAEVGDSSSGL
ncbi:MAG: hypothetical protein EHM21_17315, partial [Chloroflexi bacterium]